MTITIIPKTKEAVSFRLYHSDALSILRTLESNSISAVVTDPPYGLGLAPDAVDMLKGWLSPMGRHTPKASSGFMNSSWDNFVPQPNVWKEVLRVLKPGGYIACFAGTRTVDLMGLSLRIAGFEIRDVFAWIQAQGFPKNLDISKAFDKDLGTSSDSAEVKKWKGFGSALKPSNEPIILARKPLEGTYIQNIRKYGVGALNIDLCRIEGTPEATRFDPSKHSHVGWRMTATGAECAENASSLGRYPTNVLVSHTEECVLVGTTTVKVAVGGSSERNEHGVEAYWGEGGGGFKQGRSTVSHGDENGTETVPVWECHPSCPILVFPDSKGQQGNVTGKEPSSKTDNCYGEFEGRTAFEKREEKIASAARFFYQPKANSKDRNKYCTTLENKHPTIKPLALIKYLCDLICPPEGTILDCFSGSATTGLAALENGFDFVGVERDAEFYALGLERLTNCKAELSKL